MKFKVGQKVRAKGDLWFNKGELLTIVKLDALEPMCQCKGVSGVWWQDDDTLEPLVSFQEKLDRFKSEPIGFLVKSKEIADELTKVFDREHMKPLSGGSTKEFMAITLDNAKDYPGDAYVCYNVKGYEGNLMYGTSDFTSEHKRELFDVTLDELKEYLKSTEDFKDSEQEEHMKITIETDGHHKTTAECNGITAESLCNPTDEFKLPKGVHMAVQRLLEKLEEDTGFHVGDIVEVVANEFNFDGNPVGLQGIVEWSNRDGADVKLPTRDEPLTFYNRELKLIRRGNN